jgi:type II secretory pathway component PulF
LEDYYEDEPASAQSIAVVKKFIIGRYRQFKFSRSKQIEYISIFMSMVEEMSPLETCNTILELEDGRNTPTSNVTQSIESSLKNGGSISEGMKGWFDEDIMVLFETAMSTNNPTTIIAQYQKSLLAQAAIQKNYIQAWRGPLLKAVAACVGLSLLSSKILVEFIGFIPLEDWPDMSRKVYLAGMFLYEGGLYLLMAIIIAFVGMMVAKTNWSGENRVIFDNKIPLFSVFRLTQSMSLLQIMSLLIGADLSPRQAIENIKKSSSSKYLIWHLENMLENQSDGSKQLSTILNTGLLTRELYVRLAALERVDSSQARIGALSKVSQMSLELANSKLSIKGQLLGSLFNMCFFIILMIGMGAMGLLNSSMSTMVGG